VSDLTFVALSAGINATARTRPPHSKSDIRQSVRKHVFSLGVTNITRWRRPVMPSLFIFPEGCWEEYQSRSGSVHFHNTPATNSPAPFCMVRRAASLKVLGAFTISCSTRHGCEDPETQECAPGNDQGAFKRICQISNVAGPWSSNQLRQCTSADRRHRTSKAACKHREKGTLQESECLPDAPSTVGGNENGIHIDSVKRGPREKAPSLNIDSKGRWVAK
jgi:hypothetical protein